MDPDGRYLILIGHINSVPVTLIDIYGPNFDCPEFFHKVFNSIPNLNNTNVIVAGDMNCVLDTNLDKSFSTTIQQSKSGKFLNTTLKNLNIVDIWRLSPKGREYSFFSPVHKSYSCIDYFFLDSKLISAVKDSTYHPILISDHSPVTVVLQVADLNYRRQKNWRFNPTLLEDEAFHNQMEEHILFFLKSNDKGRY